MGELHFGMAGGILRLDDRTLAHLRSVILTRLRRHEGFGLSWDVDGGRNTIWLHPGVSIRFVFDTSEHIDLNPEWLQRLSDGVTLHGGIVIQPEYAERSGVADSRPLVLEGGEPSLTLTSRVDLRGRRLWWRVSSADRRIPRSPAA